MKNLIKSIICFAAAAICCGIYAEPRDVSFKAELDGTEQFYVEMLPADFDQNKQYDLLIGLHGHGSDRNQFATAKRGETDAFRAFAAKYGMITVTPDYRARTSWMGPKAEADMLQIINDLKKKYKIKKVFVVGGSMGATSAMTFAAIHPEMVDGVTSLNGHANHLEFANFQPAISESFGGSKEKIPLEYKKRSAEYWPEVLTMPIAFTTGGKDTAVPPESSIRLAEILKKLNRKVLLIHRPAVGHETDFADSMAAMEFMYNPLNPASVAVAAVPAQAGAEPSSSTANPGDWATAQPASDDAIGKVELGLKFSVEKAGKIKEFRFYQAKGESGAHTFRLWDATGKLLLAVKAPEKPDPGWISVPVPEPFAANPGNVFVASYTSNTNYPATPGFFKTPIRRGDITAITGVYSFDSLGEKAPDKIFNDMNYFIDIQFEQ